MAANPGRPGALYLATAVRLQPARAAALWEKSVELGADSRCLPQTWRRSIRAPAASATRCWPCWKGVQYAATPELNSSTASTRKTPWRPKNASPARSPPVRPEPPRVIARNQPRGPLRQARPGVKLIKSLYFRAWEAAVPSTWRHVGQRQHRRRASTLCAKQYKEPGFYRAPSSCRRPWRKRRRQSAAMPSRQLFCRLAYEALGDTANARQAWTSTSTATAPPRAARRTRWNRPGGRGGGGSSGSGARVAAADAYFQALAAQKLGDTAAPNALSTILTNGTQAPPRTPSRRIPTCSLPDNAAPSPTPTI